METRCGIRHLADVSVASSKNGVRKQTYRERGLEQRIGLARIWNCAIRLIAAMSVCTLLLPVVALDLRTTPTVWAGERADRADIPFQNSDSRDTRSGAAPVLTVTSSNPNSGVSVTVSPNDVTGLGSGITPFSRTYKVSMRVTLTAPLTAGGNNFQKWQRNGVDYATTSQTTVTMDADYTLTAVYVTPTVRRTLTVASANPDSGVSITISPNDIANLGNGTTPFTRAYINNTVVTLTAPPTAGGNNFVRWQRNGADYATTEQVSVPMDADYTLKAVYATPTVTHTLTLTSSNPDSGVTITVTPPDNDRQSSGVTPFTRTYNDKTIVTLTAPRTAGGNNFVRWRRNGADYSNESQISITMDAAQTLQTLYEPITATRTLNVISSDPNGLDVGALIILTPNDKNGQGSGTTPFVRYYHNNTAINLTATGMVGGNYFMGWEINGAPNTDAVATVTMDRDNTVIALYAPPTIGINFAVYGQESVTIGKGSSISGGNVGVRAMGGEAGEAYAVNIMGARVAGDVYGDAVHLGKGTQVQTVFANHLTNEKGRYKRLASLPDKLPRVLPLTGGNSGEEAIIVPAKGRAVLGQLQTEVRVEDGGTAVLSGGRYECESLVLGKGSRLMVEAPSFLIVNRFLEIGEKAIVGPADSKVPLNLTIVVRGADKNRSAAILGLSSKIQAAIRVPSGTLEIRNKVKASGSYYASVVNVGEGVSIASPSWDDAPDRDPQCVRRVCRSVGHQIVCQNQVTEGSPCDDGNACTVGDVCTAGGFCKSGTPITNPNPHGNPCLRDTCDPIAGIYEPLGAVCDSTVQCRQPSVCDGQGGCQILGALLPQGTLCDDGIPNNGIDTCTQFGSCFGSLGQFDCKANTCSPNAASPPDLTCWFNTHPSLRFHVGWWDHNNNAVKSWADWTPEKKQELQQAFVAAWQWLAGGMINFQGTPIPEPPPNSLNLADNDEALTIFTEETAWQLYLAEVAHSLAIEIRHEVPWSLCDYPNDTIDYFLNGYHNYRWTGFYVDWNYPLGYIPGWSVTPAHPTVTYPFLYQNGLIGSTRYETIVKLLEWSLQLSHFAGGWDTANMAANWQYRGLPPVSRTIEGTESPTWPHFGHWTAGCHGTAEFLKDVLRSVNVPATPLEVCWHATPYFPSENLYLSHGDDPYFGPFKGSTVVPQPGEILIDQATYLNWFTGSDEYVCGNIGKRAVDLTLQLVPDPLVMYYCWDVAANTPHDSGHVYDVFKSYYTLQELEAAQLWERLSHRASELGLCTGN